MEEITLNWEPIPLGNPEMATGPNRQAQLGEPGRGVQFYLTYHPTCYRRGPWRLLVEVEHGPEHNKWGCFDEQDQPLRNFHGLEAALSEAKALANVLWRDYSKFKKWEEDQHVQLNRNSQPEPNVAHPVSGPDARVATA